MKIFLILNFHSQSIIIYTCRYSSSVERQLPKLERRVRLPLSAYYDDVRTSILRSPYVFLF